MLGSKTSQTSKVNEREKDDDGSCCPFFVGRNMAKEFARSFYSSSKWNKCRKAYIENRMMIDGGMCEECHEQVGYILHHKVMLDESNINDATVSLNHENLEYVCKDCHDKFEGHGVGRIKYKAVCIFDENGMPIGRIEDLPHEK